MEISFIVMFGGFLWECVLIADSMKCNVRYANRKSIVFLNKSNQAS